MNVRECSEKRVDFVFHAQVCVRRWCSTHVDAEGPSDEHGLFHRQRWRQLHSSTPGDVPVPRSCRVSYPARAILERPHVPAILLGDASVRIAQKVSSSVHQVMCSQSPHHRCPDAWLLVHQNTSKVRKNGLKICERVIAHTVVVMQDHCPRTGELGLLLCKTGHVMQERSGVGSTAPSAESRVHVEERKAEVPHRSVSGQEGPVHSHVVMRECHDIVVHEGGEQHAPWASGAIGPCTVLQAAIEGAPSPAATCHVMDLPTRGPNVRDCVLLLVHVA